MATDENELAALLRQEELLQLSTFDNEDAISLGLRLLEVARAEHLPITIDIRRNGQQLFHCALPGTTADNDAWIKRKNRVVNRFGHSSYYMGRHFASQGGSVRESALLDETRYATHGGAFPIRVRGVGAVGTVTVSGLPQREDHELVVRVLALHLGVTLDA
ncbi:MAG TPA: heme-degrading domain-containing protein [Ktedonobacterales bacterium]